MVALSGDRKERFFPKVDAPYENEWTMEDHCVVAHTEYQILLRDTAPECKCISGAGLTQPRPARLGIGKAILIHPGAQLRHTG